MRANRLDLTQLAVILIALFSFSASVVVNRAVFERLPHLEDEFAYLFQARIFARGQAWVPRHEPVKVFWQPFVIQPEQAPDGVQKRFGKYTPGWPLLLAPGAAIDAPWIVNALFAMLGVALTYRLGREMFSPAVGVVGTLLLAISPVAILLNASLMSHTSAMFLTALFFYSYWRLYHLRRGRFRWAVVAGLTLGLIVASRPLTAAAIAVPVVIHAVAQLLDNLVKAPPRFMRFFAALLVLSVCVLPTGILWPVFNQIWTGDWRTNVYTLQWEYDRVGFGIGHGPNQTEGHTLAKGWRNARADLEFYFRDLYGFTLNPTLTRYAETHWGYGAGIGLSYVLIILGMAFGWRNEWVWLLLELLLALVIAQLFYWIGSSVNGAAVYSVRYYYEATFAVCLVSACGLVGLAQRVRRRRQTRAVPGFQHVLPPGLRHLRFTPIDYLNGVNDRGTQINTLNPTFEQRMGMAWRSWSPIYLLLLVACGVSLAGYTPARLSEPVPHNDCASSSQPVPNVTGLYRFNLVGQDRLDDLRDMRIRSGTPDKPVLIVVLKDPDPDIRDCWRFYATTMAMTSPFLDSEIVVARVFEKSDAEEFVRRFPGRLVLYQIGNALYWTVDDAMAGLNGKSVPPRP